MAHVTEMAQAPMYDPGAIWCSSWGPEKIETQWKAPTPRITEQPKYPPTLPSWLENWTPVPEHTSDDVANIEVAEESIENGYDVPQQEKHIKDYFNDFDTAIGALRRECSKITWNELRDQQLYGPAKALELCESFGEKLQQSLMLGLVSSDLLSSALQKVTDVLVDISRGLYSISDIEHSDEQISDIRDNYCGNDFGLNERLLAFYARVWKGILSCKILKPADFHSKVMGEYLCLLANLPSTTQTQLLTSEVLPSLSASQLGSNIETVLSLLNKWSLSWLKILKDPPNIAESLATAEASVLASQKRINHLKMLVWFHRGKETSEVIQSIRDVLIQASAAFLNGRSDTLTAERLLIPHSHSIDVMSIMLDRLPGEVMSTLTRSHSELIASPKFLAQKRVQGSKDYLAQSHRVRFNWLSVMSKMGSISESMFTEAFDLLKYQKVGEFYKRYTLTDRQTCELLLNRWRSQGLLANSDYIIDTFKRETLRSPWSFGWLFSILKKDGQLCEEKIHDLFDFLPDELRYPRTDAIITQSTMFNLQINDKVLTDLVNNLAPIDLQAAYDIYMKHCLGKVEPEACAPLIAALIYHGSGGVWAALDTPIFASLPNWRKNASSPQPLSQSRIILVHEVAKAFAHSNVKNRRQCLRGVTQSWHYLRAHKVKPTNKISRPITHVGITADIQDAKWGRTERVRWALSVIERAEGPEVADAVRSAVVNWRATLRTALEKRKRGYTL